MRVFVIAAQSLRRARMIFGRAARQCEQRMSK
jgi:hypothetical protein